MRSPVWNIFGTSCWCLTFGLDILQPNPQIWSEEEGEPPRYRCRLGCILSIWVGFSSRQQRYCCWQAGDEGAAEHGLERLCRKARQLGMGRQERLSALAAVVRRRFLG